MEAAEAESGIEVPMEDKVAAVAKEKAQKAGMWMKGQARWPAAETDTRHALCLGATLPHRPVTAGPATWPVLSPLQAVSPPPLRPPSLCSTPLPRRLSPMTNSVLPIRHAPLYIAPLPHTSSGRQAEDDGGREAG